MNSGVSVPLLYANLSYDTFRAYIDKFENLETKLRSFMDDLHSKITKRVGTKDRILLNKFLKNSDTHQLYMDTYYKCSRNERDRIDAIHGLLSDSRVELDGFMAQYK